MDGGYPGEKRVVIRDAVEPLAMNLFGILVVVLATRITIPSKVGAP